MKRSKLPNSARWIMNGRSWRSSALVYVASRRSGIIASSWIVPICQARPIESVMCRSIFGA